MNPESFEKQDREFMERLKKLRDQSLPEHLLKGFSASVEKRIFENKKYNAVIPVFTIIVSGLGIAAAVLFIFWHFHPLHIVTPQPEIGMKQPAAMREGDVSEDLAVLEAVEAWTQEDEAALGNTLENALGELEAAMNSNGTRVGAATQISVK